ncbi:MAG: hypothetical protein IKO74_06710 [Selenomonadaceae bacterium]|nr:hypothetical protein [Selenomonadaceae bacterium]
MKRRAKLDAPSHGQRFDKCPTNSPTAAVSDAASWIATNNGTCCVQAGYCGNLCPEKVYHGRRLVARKFFDDLKTRRQK